MCMGAGGGLQELLGDPLPHPRCWGNAEIQSMSKRCVALATLMNESRSVTVETRLREESPVAMAMP